MMYRLAFNTESPSRPRTRSDTVRSDNSKHYEPLHLSAGNDKDAQNRQICREQKVIRR